MSLIRVRRNRKKNWLDTKRFFSTRTLVILFLVAIAAILYATDLVDQIFATLGGG